MELIPNDVSPKLAYGRWNSIAAFSPSGTCLGITAAHDGDFFPESPEDYVPGLKEFASKGQRAVFPVRVDIDITQECNAHCTFCFSRPYQAQGVIGQWIKIDALRAIIDSCAEHGVKTIRYCGGGDPLLHPNIDELLTLPKKRGLNLTVITNGDLIDDHRADLIAENVDHLRWSVNANTDKTRLLVHRPSPTTRPLSETKEQIRRIVRFGKEREAKSRTMIWATYLLIPENFLEAEACAVEFAQLGVDSLSFRPVFHQLHTDWSSNQIGLLEPLLKKLPEYSRLPNYRVIAPKRDIIREARLTPSEHFSHCLSRQLRTVVEAFDGGARLQSCGTYRGRQDSGDRIELLHADFAHKWRTFSARFSPESAPEQCSTCIDISINRTLAFMASIIAKEPGATFLRARA